MCAPSLAATRPVGECELFPGDAFIHSEHVGDRRLEVRRRIKGLGDEDLRSKRAERRLSSSKSKVHRCGSPC